MRSLRRTTVLAVAALAAPTLVAFTPGTAEDPCYDAESEQYTFEEQQVWFHEGETKVGNLGSAGVTDYHSWDTTPPQRSVQDGGGAGALGNFAGSTGGQEDSPFDATLEGTFTGCIDTALVELYAFLPTNRTSTAGDLEENPHNLQPELYIDDRQVVFPAETEVKTELNGEGPTYRLRFAVTGIHAAIVRGDLDPTAEHTIRLKVTPEHANTDNAIYVWDTTEVPSGIIFNGTPDETYTKVRAF